MVLGAVARSWDARCLDLYLEDDPRAALREELAAFCL